MSANLYATATECRTSALETAPATASLTVNVWVTLTRAGVVPNVFEGVALLNGQPYEVFLQDQRLGIAHVGSDQPILCDAYATRDGHAPPPPGSSGGSSGGGVDVGGLFAILGPLLALCLCCVCAGLALWGRKVQQQQAPAQAQATAPQVFYSPAPPYPYPPVA